MSLRAASYAVRRAPCSNGRVSSTQRRRSRPDRCAASATAKAVPSPPDTSAPLLQCVRTRCPPAGSKLVQQRQPCNGHPGAGLGVLPVQRPRRGWRAAAAAWRGVAGPGERLLVSRLGPAHTDGEVYRWGGHPPVAAASLHLTGSGRRRARRRRRPRCPAAAPAHGERADRLHERGRVRADQFDLLGRQPGLVQQDQHRAPRVVPPSAVPGSRSAACPCAASRVLISHAGQSAPLPGGQIEGAQAIPRPVRTPTTPWHDGCQPAAAIADGHREGATDERHSGLGLAPDPPRPTGGSRRVRPRRARRPPQRPRPARAPTPGPAGRGPAGRGTDEPRHEVVREQPPPGQWPAPTGPGRAPPPPPPPQQGWGAPPPPATPAAATAARALTARPPAARAEGYGGL